VSRSIDWLYADHIAAAQPHHCRGLVLVYSCTAIRMNKALLVPFSFAMQRFDVVDEDDHVVETSGRGS